MTGFTSAYGAAAFSYRGQTSEALPEQAIVSHAVQ